MKAWERERRLLERLQEQGSLALTEACALTGASVATTRRDFELLQEKGLAQRTHGGLQLPKKEEPKGYLQGTAILNHTDEEKYRIAQEAAASVKAGESVFLGAGKTCNMLASMLQNVERLTVVTTSITAVLELAECPNASVTLLGGDVLRGFYFDKVFITVDGIDLERGYTVNNKNQIGLYTQLARMTRRFYILADSAKYDRRAFASVFPPEKTCRMITTSGAPQKYLDFYARQGIPCTVLPFE